MLSGRHFLFLGALAGAALISIRDSQIQVRQGYEMAKTEQQLRKTRQEIEVHRSKLLTLRSPSRVLAQATSLNLELEPASSLSLYPANTPSSPSNKSLPALPPIKRSSNAPRPPAG